MKGKSHPILAGIAKKRDPWRDHCENMETILKFILRTFSLSAGSWDQ
jgi:hypothetical protein